MNGTKNESWLFRTGIVIRSGVGYLLACDPKVEESSPHAKVLVVQGEKRFESWVKFNAHSICRVTSPENGVLVLCSDAFYALFARQVHVGNVFKEVSQAEGEPRYGNFRSVAAIGGKAYAVGTRGMIYRFDGLSAWTRIDFGVPDDFDAQAICGFGENDLYAVGFRGALMHYDGRTWIATTLPTNINLSAVLCAPDGAVYLAGHRGTMLRGRGETWREVGDATEDIWGLAWFGGAVYASTFGGVLRVQGDGLVPVSFAPERPRSFYQLSAGEDVLWSIGESDVLSFDGVSWSRVE